MHRCEDVFEGMCWWRNKWQNCCDIFAVQRSEFGFCYSFNSVTNRGEQKRRVSNWLVSTRMHINNNFHWISYWKEHDSSFPWRTSSYGDWSGLKANVFVQSNNNTEKNHYGILVSRKRYLSTASHWNRRKMVQCILTLWLGWRIRCAQFRRKMKIHVWFNLCVVGCGRRITCHELHMFHDVSCKRN